jgi:hypothetical protein
MIYFALNKTTDLIKIGYSANVIQRLSQLRAKKNDVVLLGCVMGDRQIEKQMHEWFFRFHSTGEWFQNVPEIHQYVEEHKLPPRLVVAEHAWMSFKDDYHGKSVSREMINRLVALANEKRVHFAELASAILLSGIEAMEAELVEEALDAREKKGARK